MTFKRFDGSNFVDPANVRRWDGSAWVDAGFARRWDGSAWQNVWPLYVALGVTVAPPSYFEETANNSGPYTPSFTATVTGGNGSHTFTWGITGTGLSILSGQGTASVQVQITNGTNVTRSGALSLTVDDGVSNASVNVSIDHVYTTI